MSAGELDRPAPLEGVKQPVRTADFSSDASLYEATVAGESAHASMPGEAGGGPDLHHKERAPTAAAFMVITVSDTRTLETDASGRMIHEAIAEAGYRVALYRIVKDDDREVEAAIREGLESSGVELIVVSGGTGMSQRDGTYEVVSRLLDKRLDGFGEIFRFLSFQQIGSAAMLSRAVGGISRGKPIFSVPGSPQAASLAMRRLILPETGHLLFETRR